MQFGNILHLTSLIALAFYCIASILSLVSLWTPRIRISHMALYSFFVAFTFHTISLVGLLVSERSVLLQNGADSFFFSSWLLALCFVFFKRKSEFPIIGAILLPAVTIFMGSSSYLLHQGSRAITDEQTSPSPILITLHAVPALVAVVSLALGFVVSVVFIIVERKIRSRSAKALSFKGPSLATLDSLTKRFSLAGFIAMTFVVLSGAIWSVSEHQRILFDPSVASTLIVWALLGGLLHARLALNWSSRRLARLTAFVTGLFFVSIYVLLFATGSMTHSPHVS